MIFGRLQLQAGSDRVWDYVACLYPEGNISDSYNIFFNQEDIDKILFKGYQTKEEQEFQKLLLVNYEQLNA
jgi:hypothetical protein